MPSARAGAVLAAVVALVAAGCGNSASAEEKYADSVCTKVGDWQSELKQSRDDIKAQLQSPQGGMADAIAADVRKAQEATRRLAKDLEAVDVPETQSSAQVKAQVDALAAQLDATVAKAKRTVESLPEGASVTEKTKALAPLAPELQSLAANVSRTVDAIKATASNYNDGFDKADSCNGIG